MESPPSFSTHSEVPPLSEDSGLLITSGSFSSDSASGWQHIASELQESDFDERSLSLCSSADMSERAPDFSTVRKAARRAPLEPPPAFQDEPTHVASASAFVSTRSKRTAACAPSVVFIDESKSPSCDVAITAPRVSPLYPRKLKPESLYDRRQCLHHRFASPRLLHLSPCRANRPSSRNSLSSRLSSSHNSLASQFQADDSSFITQAISHDTLSADAADITDMYNVPFDSDIYAVPVDTLRPGRGGARGKGKKALRSNRRRAKSGSQSGGSAPERGSRSKEPRHRDAKTKRHSLPSSAGNRDADDADSLHSTLREMRKYLHTLYSSSSDSECRADKKSGAVLTSAGGHARRAAEPRAEPNNNLEPERDAAGHARPERREPAPRDCATEDKPKKGARGSKTKMSPVRLLSLNLKQSFCNLFRWRRGAAGGSGAGRASPPPAVRRALPPLPPAAPPAARADDAGVDFASSIQKVKDYGWYWGPLSVEAAEKLLGGEPDGSFIVRDSSDDHYIFTLSFKLNGLRHVRIEHDQGNFCFGGCTMFKAQTIVDFIENAVETSRSGRYLFFLNLRPALGPVRVQLLYPVSRFKRVQSLQHTCRFVILKCVRRDLVCRLPLPRRLLDYLSATHYYSELLAEI